MSTRASPSFQSCEKKTTTKNRYLFERGHYALCFQVGAVIVTKVRMDYGSFEGGDEGGYSKSYLVVPFALTKPTAPIYSYVLLYYGSMC